jgi:ABC-type multidrug transport system fused ATPase/permease subunit
VDVALKALEQSQLLDYLNSLPDGIHSMVGNRGSKLSGGQKQRLGIARALYTSPKFLILDEATSALDGVVENDLSLALNNLRNSVTLVIVAHRLSTVKMADNILYVESGRIQASGTFDQLREKVPHFDLQAKLSGL